MQSRAAGGLVLAMAAALCTFGPAAGVLPSAAAAPPGDAPNSSSDAPEELYTRVAPSVVTIFVKDEDGAWIGSGSGFVLDKSELPRLGVVCTSDNNSEADAFPIVLPDEAGDETSDETDDSAFDFPIDLSDDGSVDTPVAAGPQDEVAARAAYVLTNYHVIRSAAAAEVYFSSGQMRAVESVTAEDEGADLALLRIALPARATVRGIRLAAEDPRVFTTVYAIGSPRGLPGTASAGHVSGYQTLEGHRRWLQTTAPISPGSSGGPLLLANGTVAGVTTMCLLESQNLNFAVPASNIREFLARATVENRDLAAGRCLQWEEARAFRKLQAAVSAPDAWQFHADSAAQLAEALETLNAGIERAEAARVEQAIELAEEVEYSLPADFEYLVHYLIGKASVRLAEQETPHDGREVDRTQADAIRYRDSLHALAAADRLAQATSLAPDFAPAHERLARHHAHSGHWADALLAADEVVRLMPRSPAALALRAECYRALHESGSAADDLKEATRLSPRDAKLHYELAKVRSKLGEYDEAVDEFTLALAFDAPDIREAIHYHRGVAYRCAGNDRKAIADFTAAKALGWPADECDAALAASGQQQVGETFPIHARLLDHGVDKSGRTDAEAAQTTVYVTKTGKKYHRSGCRHLSHSKMPMPLEQAARTYGPCSHCRPPTP